jgi:hypothetical protein
MLKIYQLQGRSLDIFYKSLDSMLGRSVVFIVKKVLHSLDASHISFDVLNMSSDESVRKRFVEDGMVYAPYKVYIIISYSLNINIIMEHQMYSYKNVFFHFIVFRRLYNILPKNVPNPTR